MKNSSKVTVYLLMLLAIFSCKKKIDGSSIGTEYIGTWKLKNITCSSGNLVPVRWQELLMLNESNGAFADIGPDCYWTNNSFSVKSNFDSVQFEGGASACSPASCSITGWFDNGLGTQSGITQTCVAGVSQATTTGYKVDSSGLLTSTNGQGCTVNYQRISGSAPNASCLSHDSGAVNATQTGGFSTLRDGLDKAGFRFTVTTSNKQLWGIKLKMSSPSLTSATVKIYEGGNQPENGTLLTTSVLTDNLNQSSIVDHYFHFFDAPILKVGTNYYMTIQGLGSPTTGSFSIAFNSATTISQTQAWAYTTSWSLFGTQSPNMGFIFGAVGCQ